MSDRYELGRQASDVAETCKAALEGRAGNIPDKTTLSLAQNILTQAKGILPGDPLIQNLSLDGEQTWTGTQSAMRAVANACGKAPATVAFSAGTRGRGRR